MNNIPEEDIEKAAKKYAEQYMDGLVGQDHIAAACADFARWALSQPQKNQEEAKKIKANNVYINSEGVPCAPTVDRNKKIKARFFEEQMKETDENERLYVEGCVPIAEDQREMVMDWIKETTLQKRLFYYVEPYEFMIETKAARIIKSAALINEPVTFKQLMDKLYAAYPGHRFVLINENAKDGQPTEGENEWSKSENAESKESQSVSQPQKNEGYSIKPLEWVESHMNGTKIFEATGVYMRYEVWDDRWRRYLHDPSESFIHGGDCIDYEDGKRQAQKHFESKINPYLIESVSQPQWIDVKERLPELNGNYLCTLTWDDFPDMIDVIWFEKPHWLALTNRVIKYWMPLPEYPKP